MYTFHQKLLSRLQSCQHDLLTSDLDQTQERKISFLFQQFRENLKSFTLELFRCWLTTKPKSGCTTGLAADLLRVDCQYLLSTGLLQVNFVSTSCNKSANDKLQQA